MLGFIRRVIFWTYARGSWQYDILCALILCFIFLTPKAVFDGSAFLGNPARGIPEKEAEETEEARASVAPSLNEPEPTDEKPSRMARAESP